MCSTSRCEACRVAETVPVNLQPTQIVRNLGASPLNRPYKLPPDDSIAIDHISLRPAKRAVQRTSLLRPITHRNDVEVVVFQKFVIRRVVRVNADASTTIPFSFSRDCI